MTQLTENKVQDLISSRKTQYKNIEDTIAAYNREKELANEYNGRQVLELLQNADDEKARTVEIALDKEKCTLSVYNDGAPFTYEGIKSIMVPNLSSKTTSAYIGNKGLGFRSILVWADTIAIETGDFRFEFSKKIAEDVAREIGLDLEAIREQQGLSEEAIPFPLLAVPLLTSPQHPLDKGCRIIVHYRKSFESDIIAQIEKLDETAMLFLRNIVRISMDVDGQKKELSISKHASEKLWEGASVQEITASSSASKWTVISTAPTELPSEYQDKNKREAKKFGISIAIPGTETASRYPLYNYLPTEENIELPYIIHATLDLDSARKHVNDAPLNCYILQQAADFIVKYVEHCLASASAYDWTFFRWLTPLEKTSKLIEENLCEVLRKQRDGMSILPTVGNQYVGFTDYFYYNNADSQFWQGFEKKIPSTDQLLLPVPNELSIDERRIPGETFCRELNGISEKLSIQALKELILYLVDFAQNGKHAEGMDGLYILQDDDRLTIKEGVKVFTPSNQEKYSIPSYVKIAFLNRELHEALIRDLKGMSVWDDAKNAFAAENTSDNRIFAAVLIKCGIRISDYDKNELIKEIVSQTNKQGEALNKDVVIEMLSCLLRISVDADVRSVKLLDQEGNVCPADELLMPTPLNKALFPNNTKYLFDFEDFPLSEYDSQFRCLGVNKLIRKDKIDEGDLWRYWTWLIENKAVVENKDRVWNSINRTRSEFRPLQMSKLLQLLITNLSLDQIIQLLSEDRNLKDVLTQTEQLKFSSYNKSTEYYTTHTYLRYQFCQLPQVKNKILSKELFFTTDEALKQIDTPVLELALNYLTTNISSIEKKELVRILNDKSHLGKIRKLYKAVIDSGRTISSSELLLVATDADGKRDYFPSADVFYTNNNTTPLQVMRALNLKRLWYPLRQGDKVAKTFGLKEMQEVNITIDTQGISLHQTYTEFSQQLERMKWLVLLYATQKVDNQQQKKTLTGKIARLKIHLADCCRYMLDLTACELMPYEFISSGDTYYIVLPPQKQMSELKEDVDFCNAIAEILAQVFNIETANEAFIRILQNYSYMERTAQKEFGREQVEEYKQLLGISSAEENFWKKVFGSLDLQYQADSTNKTAYHTQIIESLGMDAATDLQSVDYTDWLTPQSEIVLTWLDGHCKEMIGELDLKKRNVRLFESVRSSYYNTFANQLIEALKTDVETQKTFNEQCRAYGKIMPECLTNKAGLLSSEEALDVLKKHVVQTYGFELKQEKDLEGPHCCSCYLDDLIDQCKHDDRYYSLMFYEGNTEIVEQWIAKQKKEEDGKKETSSEKNIELTLVSASEPVFIEIKPVKHRQKADGDTDKEKAREVHSEESDRAKARKGKAAERAVRDFFKKNGIVYSWVSGFSDETKSSDTHGYDFTYQEDGQERLLEVKATDTGDFFISLNEYDTAMANIDRYDIGIVAHGQLHIYKAFFSYEHKLFASQYRFRIDLSK